MRLLDSQPRSVQPSVGMLDRIKRESDFPKGSWTLGFHVKALDFSLPLLSEVVPSSGGQWQRFTQWAVVWGGLCSRNKLIRAESHPT